MQEQFLARNKTLYLRFVYLEKAFDWVPRKRVGKEWLTRAVMMFCFGASTVARTGTGDSRSFKVKVVVYQGSVLSPLVLATV